MLEPAKPIRYSRMHISAIIVSNFVDTYIQSTIPCSSSGKIGADPNTKLKSMSLKALIIKLLIPVSRLLR